MPRRRHGPVGVIVVRPCKRRVAEPDLLGSRLLRREELGSDLCVFVVRELIQELRLKKRILFEFWIKK